MSKNALDRLNGLDNEPDDISLNLDSISSDDFLNDNTPDIIAKMNFTEVTTEDEDTSETIETAKPEDIPINVTDIGDSPINEELFNSNTVESPEPKRRGRRKKNTEKDQSSSTTFTEVTVESNSKNTNSNPLYDQLVINLMEDLKKHKYKFSGFNDESMSILFEYIKQKF